MELIKETVNVNNTIHKGSTQTMASGDRQILSKALNISPSQQNYITNSNAGEGLIIYGSTIIPFKDDFPRDTQLYRIMTTKPEEIA